MRTELATSAAACAAILAGATAANASGGAAHAASAPTMSQWLLLLFTCVNFVAFLVLLRRFTRAPLREFLKTRRKEIVDLMAEAAREKAEAEALKKEYESKLAGLEHAKQELIAEVRRMADSDAQKALQSAVDAADRMRRDAERAAQSDYDRAVAELRSEAARLASSLATDDVRRRLDPAVRQRLFDEFIDGVAKS